MLPAQTNNGGTYFYDGAGRRVKKVLPGTTQRETIFVYDAFGKLAAEYSTVVATPVGGTKYLTADHLGSPRVVTDQAGEIVSRHDYTAFGEELFAGAGARTAEHQYSAVDNLRQQFTGYERDTESGLDFAQARYYNSQHGRFTSVDPLTASATIRDPQTFNRYAYALNSPYKFVDPLGLSVCNAGMGCQDQASNTQQAQGQSGQGNCPPGETCVTVNGEEVIQSDEVAAVINSENTSSPAAPVAGFQAPMPEVRTQPGRITIPGLEPEAAPGGGRGGARAGGILGLVLLFIEATTPTANEGEAAVCQANPTLCNGTQTVTQSDDKDSSDALLRVTEPGLPAFQLRSGEEGISVFQRRGVSPPLSNEEVLANFRPGSIIVEITPARIAAAGLVVVTTPGASNLSPRLQISHREIQPSSGMTRNQFKKALKSLN